MLYQVKNMVWGEVKEVQRRRFENRAALFDPQVRLVQGEKMEGVVVGGNIRCFLKLSGTRYFPDLCDKILLLEAYGGEVPQMATYLAQLKQLGAFGEGRRNFARNIYGDGGACVQPGYHCIGEGGGRDADSDRKDTGNRSRK